jgi:hypothetical protein
MKTRIDMILGKIGKSGIGNYRTPDAATTGR